MLLNKVKAEGNVITIKSNPTIGIISLVNFTDNSSGEDNTHKFIKQFRYSTNGIIFSEWYPLTPLNITSIGVKKEDTLLIELQYIKNQPSGDDFLSVSNAIIDTSLSSDSSGSTYYFDNTVFKEHFNSDDLEVLNWQINVLDKLFQKGLLPSYIERLNDFDSPDDFIHFWRAITRFFAYYVIYARKFQNFHESEILLSEYINERGLITSPLNTINELNYMMENFYKEIFHRGTAHIVDKVSNGAPVDGELLRLIQYKASDEFVFNLYKPQHFGWNIGNSSPLYRGMRINDGANKYYEPQSQPINLSKYPLWGDSFSIIQEGEKKVLEVINGGISENITIGQVSDYYIPVDEFMDYELFFMIKLSEGAKLRVGFLATDKDGQTIQLKSHRDDIDKTDFFNGIELQRSDKYIGVSLFLYNKLKPPFSSDMTSINLGEDLRLIDGVKYILPSIEVSEGTMRIYNIRFTPMRTSYSRGFLDTKNFISAWIKNNNNSIDILGIKQFIKRYLIPYNSNIELSTIVNDGSYTQEFEIV